MANKQGSPTIRPQSGFYLYTIPDKWTKAVIFRLHKEGDKLINEQRTYRGVAKPLSATAAEFGLTFGDNNVELVNNLVCGDFDL